MTAFATLGLLVGLLLILFICSLFLAVAVRMVDEFTRRSARLQWEALGSILSHDWHIPRRHLPSEEVHSFFRHPLLWPFHDERARPVPVSAGLLARVLVDHVDHGHLPDQTVLAIRALRPHPAPDPAIWLQNVEAWYAQILDSVRQRSRRRRIPELVLLSIAFATIINLNITSLGAYFAEAASFRFFEHEDAFPIGNWAQNTHWAGSLMSGGAFEQALGIILIVLSYLATGLLLAGGARLWLDLFDALTSLRAAWASGALGNWLAALGRRPSATETSGQSPADPAAGKASPLPTPEPWQAVMQRRLAALGKARHRAASLKWELLALFAGLFFLYFLLVSPPPTPWTHWDSLAVGLILLSGLTVSAYQWALEKRLDAEIAEGWKRLPPPVLPDRAAAMPDAVAAKASDGGEAAHG